MRLVKEGKADAVVTAGHTGAGVASAIINLGRLKGVDRPALAVQMVTDSGPMVLLDIGATTDSTGTNLFQYAHMGAIFAEKVLGVTNPSVALLSIGEEGGKGEQRVQEATELLERQRPALRRQCRGQGPAQASGRRRRVRRDGGQRDDQVLRGPVELHLRPAAHGVPALAAGADRLRVHAPRHRRASGSGSTTSAWAARRCSA